MLKRGGTAEGICKTIQESGVLDGKDYLSLWVGSNDLSNIERREYRTEREVDRAIQNTARQVTGMVEVARRRGIRVGVVIPPPRYDVHEELHKKYIKELTRELQDTKGCTIIDVQGRDDYNDFIDKRLRDGIHFDRGEFRGILNYVVKKMGLKADVWETRGIQQDEFLHKERCWIRGDIHKREFTDCMGGRLNCHRCTTPGHNSRVCLYRAKLCTTCRERGHHNGRCDKTYRPT